VKFFEDFGFTRIGFGFSGGTCFKKGPNDLTNDDMEDIQKQEYEIFDDILMKLEKDEPIKYNPLGGLLEIIQNRNITLVRCGIGRGTSTIDPLGDIYPCHRFVGMENYITGNISSGIDHEKVFSLLRNYIDNSRKHCFSSCWAKYICGGPCPWYVAHPSGNFLKPDYSHCKTIREDIETGIYYYEQIMERFPDKMDELIST